MSHNGPTPQAYRFLVGPERAADGRDHRLSVDVPSEYVALDRSPQAGIVALREFTFPFHYPDMKPVDPHAMAGSGIVLATFAWEPPGSVKQRVDGSWVNYFSAYSVRQSDAYGLHAAHGPDSIDTSILYTSPDQNTLIECTSIRGEPPKSCHLISNPVAYLALELRFDAALLPQWRQLEASALSLVSINKRPSSGVGRNG